MKLAMYVTTTVVVLGAADEDGALVVPLLERCAIESGLQLARFAHPSLAPLRLGLTLPSLHFHLSPGRLHRVMRVLNGALPSACHHSSQTVPSPTSPEQSRWTILPVQHSAPA